MNVAVNIDAVSEIFRRVLAATPTDGSVDGRHSGPPDGHHSAPPDGHHSAPPNGLTDRETGMRIEPESDFFALGGDSLLATRVLSAVNREFGVELTFYDFLLAPTPATLAKTIDEMR